MCKYMWIFADLQLILAFRCLGQNPVPKKVEATISIKILFQILIEMFNEISIRHLWTPHKVILIELIKPEGNFAVTLWITGDISF